MTHTMIQDIRYAINQRYKSLLETINFSHLIPQNDGSFDPITGIGSDNIVTETSTNIEISFITTESIYRFLGCQLTMGLIGAKKEEDYFYGTSLMSSIISTMTYPQFKKIKRLFTIPLVTNLTEFNSGRQHFSVDNFESSDSCSKVLWYMLHLNRNFKRYLSVGSTVAIDESMCMCQSRCPYSVLMKSKPIPKGLKFYMVNDSFSGYCLNFILHNLKKGTNSQSGSTTV